MRKLVLVIVMIGSFIVGCKAQKKMEAYVSEDGGLELSRGDTIEFIGGTDGGAYEYVFYMVGKLPSRQAPFSKGDHSALVIDHFLRKKVKGEQEIYAVMEVPNLRGWSVWVKLEEAFVSKEVTIKKK